MSLRYRGSVAPSPEQVISKMKRGIGASEGMLAQRLNVRADVLKTVTEAMLAAGVLVRYRTGRSLHLFIAGTEPGANVPTPRIAPMDDRRNITESTYCTDMARHRALAELLRAR